MPDAVVPKLFVHGNPETDAVWTPLVDALAAAGVTDVELLSPPGFGAPVPDGFACRRSDYCDWLIGELEARVDATGQPVDLVGHDWGAGHVYAVLATRPDLVRSWAADCAGLLHPDYEWHDAARAWQAPGGETIADVMRGLPAAAVLSWGVPPGYADALAAGIDTTMTTAMLALYRSAVQPELRQLGAAVTAAARPRGMVFEPDGDPYVPPGLSREVAASLDATGVPLPGCGHWWMWEAPARAATALISFWR